MSSAFEAEIRKQIEAKQQQRLQEKLLDQQLTLNQYKNYPLAGGHNELPVDVHSKEQQIYEMMQQYQAMQPNNGVQIGTAFQGNMNNGNQYSAPDLLQRPSYLFDDKFLQGENNNLVSNAQLDPSQMSERDRRIYLRDKERERRNQVPPAGGGVNPSQLDCNYGGVAAPIVQQSPFSLPSSVQSNREAMLQMKAQQRQQMVPTDLRTLNPPAEIFQPSRPINFEQIELANPMQQFSNRNSLVTPQSIPLQFNESPQAQQLKQEDPQLVFGHNNFEQDRRVLQNKQRQQEYQEHLAQQDAKKHQGHQSSSDQLVLGGLQQIGDHQYKKNENKQKQQLEYKRILEEQQQQKKETPVLNIKQKLQIADQVFNDIIDSQRAQATPQRIQSAVGANRQLELQKLQMQQTKDMFMKHDAEELRRQEIEKKKEYAAMLQQQMQMKKNEKLRVTSAPVQDNIKHHEFSQNQYQQPYQMNQMQINQQYVPEQQFQEYRQPSAQQYLQQMQPNSKEEYRRELEQQMKEAQEKKLRAKQDKLNYDLRNDKDLADYIQPVQQQPVQQQVVRRGQSDITKMPKVEDENKIQQRLRYQEELKQQVAEQKQRKLDEQIKEKQYEEMQEQKLAMERQKLVGRERNEIYKETGKQVQDEQPKRQVNRAQFEQSLENGGQKREILLNSPPVVDLKNMPTFNSASNDDYGMMPPIGSHKQFNMPPTPSSSTPPIIHPFNTQTQMQHQYSNQIQQQQQQYMVQPHPHHFNTLQQPPTSWQPEHQNPNELYMQQQTNKMFEDQQKMIQLYQQALEQILKYRNQYFEQAMEMRENVLKEREQMLEFEKLKQNQLFEMQQLQAVKQQLGSVQEKRQQLAPQIQSHLTQYIVDQQQQIHSMSQSQLFNSQASPRFTVETARVKVNALPQGIRSQEYGSDVYEQVDEIADYVNRISQEQQFKSLDLEMSLNSITKLVKVPVQNNLVAKAKQIIGVSPARVPTATKEDMLLTTWNENSLEQAYPLQSKSPQNKSPNIRSQSEVVPATSPQIQRSVQLTAESAISRKVQLQASGNLHDRKATITGSSFYDQTLKIQKIQEESQKEEMQKQMLRIFGNVTVSSQKDRADESAETPSLHVVTESQFQTAPLSIMVEQQSCINIANTMTEGFNINQNADEDAQMFNQIVDEVQQNHQASFLFQDQPSPPRSIAYQTQSEWENTNEMVPLVFQNQSQQQVSQYSNYEVQEINIANQSPVDRDNNSSVQMQDESGLQECEQRSIIEPFIQQTFDNLQTFDQIQQSNQHNQDDEFDEQDGQAQEEPALTKKQIEMIEIEALIRKAQLSANFAVEQAEKKQRKPVVEQPSPAGANILADLERIINNLENQKNLATFGLSGKNQNGVNDSVIDIAQHVDEEPAQQRWKTLQEAREARPTTSKSNCKAPLVPKARQDSTGRSRLSNRIDGSPQQVVGKFSQMAIARTPQSDRSQDRSATSKSPQRIGQFAQMALNNSTLSKQDRSFTSKSPQRVGKFAQMALDNSFKSKCSNGSVSPSQGLGRFAQMAVCRNNDISQDEIDNISRKYSNDRNTSRNQSQIINQNDINPTPSLLRPISGSYSSRYQHQDQKLQQRPISNIKAHTKNQYTDDSDYSDRL